MRVEFVSRISGVDVENGVGVKSTRCDARLTAVGLASAAATLTLNSYRPSKRIISRQPIRMAASEIPRSAT